MRASSNIISLKFLKNILFILVASSQKYVFVTMTTNYLGVATGIIVSSWLLGLMD